MKVKDLKGILETLEPDADIRVSILKNGLRSFGDTKRIESVDPIVDQDTGEFWYTLRVSISEDEAEFIKKK
ncbi:hypothetical protein [Mesobacillus harenae]|uniref:hypothetical protein n=1 Tax=Mesobacillus harenae TaxID=2213203 RepID=UPI0015811314|nr:hypothetical protein [Mesobacillus harenae]